MAKRESESNVPREPDSTTQPQIHSYDSGYEHSVEHWLEVRRLFIQDAVNAEPSDKAPPSGARVDEPLPHE